jgi:hypothetical protein
MFPKNKKDQEFLIYKDIFVKPREEELKEI